MVQCLATAPRGFTVDHPRIHLLRLKRLAVQSPLGVEDWMWGPGAGDRIADAWRAVSIWRNATRTSKPVTG